jgi:hypothetical protein
MNNELEFAQDLGICAGLGTFVKPGTTSTQISTTLLDFCQIWCQRRTCPFCFAGTKS